jgi:hypothetical protein
MDDNSQPPVELAEEAAPEVVDDNPWANPPQVYNYNPENGFYTGSEVADPSPLEPGVFLLPAHATFDAPPETADANRIPVFRNGAWTVIPRPPVPQPPRAPEAPPEVQRRAKYDAFYKLLLVSPVYQEVLFPAILVPGSPVTGALAAFRFVIQDIRDGLVEPDRGEAFGGIQQTVSALLSVAGDAITPARIREVQDMLEQVGLGGLYDFRPLGGD